MLRSSRAARSSLACALGDCQLLGSPNDTLDRDRTGRGLAELGQTRSERLIARRRGALGGDVAVLVAREQQPPERRVAAVKARRPPQHDLVARSGQRDVGQPQVLAALLGDAQLAVCGELAAVQRNVDGPPVTGPRVMEEDRRLRVVGDPAGLPEKRHVDDWELQPLAAMDRQHLHGLGV